MTFKKNWETTDQRYAIAPQTIEKMVALAFPDEKLSSHEMISGGCANINSKITINGSETPYILRVYLRDKDAAYREQNLALLLKKILPIPEIYFIGNLDHHQFAITEFRTGISLRDYLLDSNPSQMEQLMTEVGKILATIQNIHFASSGFFGKDLYLQEPITQTSYINYAKTCLDHSTVAETLGQDVISKIKTVLRKYASLLPNETDNHLVHGDFDPANLLIAQLNGRWQISGVLDWEFAFSGSFLQDMANMLRYAHQMPLTYEAAFLSGLQKGNVTLPENWRLRTHLLNLLALLDCLTRARPLECPNQSKDIRELINHILSGIAKENLF